MGLRKVFSKRDPTEEEIRKDLTKAGISTKATSGAKKEETFGAFRQYANERNSQKKGLQVANPYANMQQATGNPYSNNGAGVDGADGPGGPGNPYTNGGSNPYSGSATSQSPYDRQRSGPSSASPYGERNTGNDRPSSGSPYGERPSERARPSPYDKQRRSVTTSLLDARDDVSLDLNRIPSHQIGPSKLARRPQKEHTELDLNDLPEEDDLNLDIPLDDNLPQDYDHVNSEDEEIESIKQDIRFVKQESVASTRNTLRMAEEADASATNTLGMLGSQSERLYLAEQNLLLADTQTKIADSKVSELNRLNRSIFIPAYGNPFNKKSRLQQQENKIKGEKTQEKYLREQNRMNMYQSEQRLKEGITNNLTNSEIHQKYKQDNQLKHAERYQFENDSEDDEIEKELASNLDQIGLYAKKLKQSATTMGREVDSQNERLNQIEEDADRLDINVHMNTTRLSNIR